MALNTKDLLDLKSVIEESYTDGIDAIISAELDEDGDITGVFRDGKKRLKFTITDGGISYSFLNPEVIKDDSFDWDPYSLWEDVRINSDELATYFEMGIRRLDAEKKCVKGMACGNSCVRKTKANGEPAECRKPLSQEAKKKAKAVKEKLKKEPAAKKEAKPKKEAKTAKSRTKPKAKSESTPKASESNEKDSKGMSYREKLGSAASLRQGKPIKSEEEFDEAFNQAVKSLSNEFYDDLVPIAAVRDAMGDRLTRGEFDKFLGTQYDKGYQLIGGEAPGGKYYSNQDITSGGYKTALGASRYYIKPEKGAGGNSKPKASSEPSNKSEAKPKTEKPKSESSASRASSNEKDSNGVSYKEKLGKAAELRQGKPIKSQKEFDSDLEKAYESLNSEFGYDNLVPIAAVREALGGRVSRSEFNDFLLEMQSEGDFQLIGGEAPGGKYYSNQDLTSEGIKTPLGASRYYIKRGRR